MLFHVLFLVERLNNSIVFLTIVDFLEPSNTGAAGSLLLLLIHIFEEIISTFQYFGADIKVLVEKLGISSTKSELLWPPQKCPKHWLHLCPPSIASKSIVHLCRVRKTSRHRVDACNEYMAKNIPLKQSQGWGATSTSLGITVIPRGGVLQTSVMTRSGALPPPTPGHHRLY